MRNDETFETVFRGEVAPTMACHVQLVATNKWVAAVVALVIGTAFLLNGVASMRRSSRIGYPLWKWLGLEDSSVRRPLAIATGVVSMLAGVFVLSLLICSLL